MNNKPTLLPEIQGLRAVAVGLVVLFHLWPGAIPGGYIGVDVFFVISGYLITGLLARTALRDGRISLLEFYSRRARRLLPAATAVLIATILGTLFLIPQSRWEETAQQIAASAVYVQNWVLAWLSVDYLGAEQAPSPVQHYWSLSIEEQFYVVWPLVMIGAGMLARRFGFSMRRAFVAALAVIFVASLAASVAITADEPARAYFVTSTRAWELALGGLLALTIDRFHAGPRLRLVLSAAGLLAIAVPALHYSAETAFPGYAALLPTLGTALVIMAGDIRLGAFRGLDMAVLRYLGDRSYSIYLWHWPLIAFYTVHDDSIGTLDGLALIVLTLLLSHLSYRFIEERYRHPRGPAELRPLAYGLASIAGCVVASGAIQFTVLAAADVKVSAGDPRYPGPAALLAKAPVPEDVPLMPPPAGLKRDLPAVYAEECHQDLKSPEPVHCVFGDPEAKETVALIGDSHAAQWVPALRRIAEAQGWRLVTFTKSACAFARVDVRDGGKPYRSCSQWRENAIAEIKKFRPALVVTSQSGYGYVGRAALIRGMRGTWKEFLGAGARIVAIQDTPRLPFEPGDCVAQSSEKCTAPLEKREGWDIVLKAAEGMRYVRIVHMADGICGAGTCDAVVGNIIVWRDHHHLTATYAAALAPHLARRMGLRTSDLVASRSAPDTR